MTIREDAIERANGERGIYGVVDKEPSCLVIPLETTAEGEFLYLVSQYRYTVGKRMMEFPQGTWEGSDAEPATVARGELREETGLRADRRASMRGILRRATWRYTACGQPSSKRCSSTGALWIIARRRRGACTASGANANREDESR